MLVEGSGAQAFGDAFVRAWEEAGGPALACLEADAEPALRAVRDTVAALLGAPALVLARAPTGLRAGLHVTVGPELMAPRPGVHLALRTPRPGVARALARARCQGASAQPGSTPSEPKGMR